MFIDGAEEATIGQYANYGPNNEVYLAQGQAISFKVPENEVDVYPPQKAPAAPAVSSRSLFACTWRRLSPEASPIKR